MKALFTIGKSTNATTRLILLLLIMIGFVFNKATAQSDDCAGAGTLVSGAAATCSQTTSGSSVQAGEVVAAASVGASSNFTRSVWYVFSATATSMYVELEITGNPSCNGRMAVVVYNTASCLPGAGSILQRQQYNGDGAMVLNLTGLTVGSSYRIQVGYSTGGGCIFQPTYCIAVGNSPSPCTCSAPCTQGCGYSTAPTVAQVVATCPIYDLKPLSDGGVTSTYCYSFVAASSTISFNMIITSNCGGSNVSAFTWTLQQASCGANVASGTLSSLSATGLVIGNAYVLCYTYTIPSTCYHSSLYPYFVGASPLPVTLTAFRSEETDLGVKLSWDTESEEGVDYYRIERSTNGQDQEEINRTFSLNKETATTYSYIDKSAPAEMVYYRLISVDTDGKETAYNEFMISYDNRNASPNGIITYYDLNGRRIQMDDSFKGIAIQVITHLDGTTTSTKVFQ